jgi:hypothetical protein
MTTRYGIPYILLDRTGHLDFSEFTDIENRLALEWRRTTAHDSAHTAFMIYNNTNARGQGPLAALVFGRGNSLGTICFTSAGNRGPGVHMPMKEYLTKTSPGPFGS